MAIGCRSIVEPVRNSKFRKEAHYHLAKATSINTHKQTIECVNTITSQGRSYELQYDKLVIGVGSRPNTFNVPGVTEHAFFLKVVIRYLFSRCTEWGISDACAQPYLKRVDVPAAVPWDSEWTGLQYLSIADNNVSLQWVLWQIFFIWILREFGELNYFLEALLWRF